MDNRISLTVRTATRDRKAEIGAPADATVGEILDSARENWRMPDDYEYVVRCERLGAQLSPGQTLQQAGIQPGDVLEIQPLADAGMSA
jgi:hypothetical protein